MGNQLKRAEKIGARYAVIIGAEYPELELKNMATRESMHASPNGLMAELLGDDEEV
jgi:histidyl-tRNA synthetase